MKGKRLGFLLAAIGVMLWAAPASGDSPEEGPWFHGISVAQFESAGSESGQVVDAGEVVPEALPTAWEEVSAGSPSEVFKSSGADKHYREEAQTHQTAHPIRDAASRADASTETETSKAVSDIQWAAASGDDAATSSRLAASGPADDKVAPPARRGAYSVVGASVLDEEDTAIRIGVGYPEIEVMYHMPWTTDIELAGGGGFFYGLNPKTAGDVLGFRATMEGRWRFWQDGDHTMAVTLAPSLSVVADPSRVFGLVIGGPNLVYDYRIKGVHHAILGVGIPWGLHFTSAGTTARIPLTFKMGMEFALSEDLHAFVTSESGADIWTGDYLDDTFLFVRVMAGISFLL